ISIFHFISPKASFSLYPDNYDFYSADEILSATGLQELLLIHNKGQLLYIELSLSQFTVRDRNLKICVLRDISQRRQSEKKINLVHEITHLLLRSVSIQEAMTQVLKLIATTLNWDMAYFWLWSQEDQLLKPMILYHVTDFPFFSEFRQATS